MVEQFQKMGEEFQRMSKGSYDNAVGAFGELTKRSQAIGAEMILFSKKAFEDGTRADVAPLI